MERTRRLRPTTRLRGLLALGVERGDRIGIWSPTCAEWTVLQFASARVGAILVNVNPAYRPNELLYALNKVGVRMVVTAAPVQDVGLPRHDQGSPRRSAARSSASIALGTEKTDGPDDLLWSEMIAAGAGK